MRPLGNVGSEISRALRWRSQNPELASGALCRALELLDLTLDDPRHRQALARLREIARAREVVVDSCTDQTRTVRPRGRCKTIDAYALAARRGRVN